MYRVNVATFWRRFWRPSWTALLRRFGLRFIASLVVLGVIYGLIFGFSLGTPHKPRTPSQKVAALRSALDQTYIDSNTLAHVTQNNAASYSVLTAVSGQWQTDIAAAQTALKAAVSYLPTPVHNSAQSLITTQQEAFHRYSSSYKVLSHVIAYDPATDLGRLDINHNRDSLLQRATAAQNGLKTAANSAATLDSGVSSGNLDVQQSGQPQAVISGTTQKALSGGANCFGTLADDLQSQQAAASQQRDSCIQAYPAVRKQAMQNVLGNSLPESFLQAYQAQLLPLLHQLDQLIAQATAAQTPSK